MPPSQSIGCLCLQPCHPARHPHPKTHSCQSYHTSSLWCLVLSRWTVLSTLRLTHQNRQRQVDAHVGKRYCHHEQELQVHRQQWYELETDIMGLEKVIKATNNPSCQQLRTVPTNSFPEQGQHKLRHCVFRRRWQSSAPRHYQQQDWKTQTVTTVAEWQLEVRGQLIRRPLQTPDPVRASANVSKMLRHQPLIIFQFVTAKTFLTIDNFSICLKQKTFQPFIIFQSYSNKNLYQQWIHQVQTSKLILHLILHRIQQHQVHRCNYPHKQYPTYPFCLIVCQLILVLGLFRQEHLLLLFLPLLLNPHSLLLFSLPLLLFLFLL